MRDTNGHYQLIDRFVSDIKQGKMRDSYTIATATVELLKNIITHAEWKTAKELLSIIKEGGRSLSNSLPLHASVDNMVRRILKIIREEYISAQQNKQEEVDPQESLHKIVTSEGDDDDYSKHIPQLKSAILEHISEFQVELETSADNIAQQASEHIHSNEIIMTLGKSNAVQAFLKKAAAYRKFEVIVAECAPFCHGHELALSLGKSKIQTTVITDSAIFAIMSRVNKVIIGTHTVMANGGLRALCGSHTVALAAKHFSVPVIVLAPMYKLSPKYLCSYDQDAFNSFVSPEGVLSYADGAILSKTHVFNPVFDYVPPDLVTLFISNTGGHSPSYIYRLLSELYHQDDNEK
ncbi:translation initiation factor eIF-2B subunit beta [Schistocerca americana]|uniref:translation initiation factor eIF-2B subunit beta n=1 Tax=Schistocerca americana TaxID=7009 RepID=UPI001F4F2F49|nr:translation initiation factor eIF-2B subunit beta [Schistocerca americana]XP_047116488.1 translation initiation factor eIF-2B subunit beta [Schistocerca piceifrons]XP_049786735.1 translation initiation factor eIF-2B subunit beta [Schistocerca cancellata]XP_049960704.1 translation initiation factor eIF-2B subunit beta [Schistocerca serialis cubense]